MIFSKTASESDVEDGTGDIGVFGGVMDVLDAVGEGEVGGRLERRRIFKETGRGRDGSATAMYGEYAGLTRRRMHGRSRVNRRD